MISVTAIITTYGRKSTTVSRAINSILNQSYPVQEILVIDDNKEDSSLCDDIKNVCSKYQNVKYIKQNGNQGACAARNLGLKNAKGDFIGFLDDDDQWMPEKIEKQVEEFKRNDDSLGLVFCSGIQTDEETGKTTDYYNVSMKKDISFEDELGCDFIGSTSNPLIRKTCFDAVGGFWTNQPARQDYEMWLRIAKQFRIKGIEGKYFIYSIHEGDQITKDKNKSYCGFRNIYLRYKQDYLKYPGARLNILNWIIWNRPGINKEVLGFWLERALVKIRLKINL